MRALLLIASLLLFQQFSFAQAQRLVMVEHFTNASCAPCAAQNPAFNQLLVNNSEKVVKLKYQTNWPGFDPMNAQNPTEVAARVSYYGITGVPNVRLDGALNAGTSGQVTAAQINNAYAVPTPLEIVLTHSLSADLSTIYVNCIITNLGAVEFNVANTVVQVAVIEEELIFPEPPGSTNEVDFYNVMRKMLPNASGTSLPAIPAGESFELNLEYALPSYIYRYDQLGVVAFVQTNGTRVVHQAAVSETLGAPDGYADLGVVLANVGPDAYCEYSLTPAANITNHSITEVTSFDLEFVINGAPIATENWTGSLLPGESIMINFPTMELTPGAAEVEYNILAVNETLVNGAIDLNSLNNGGGEVFYTLADEPVGNAIQEGFESTANLGTPPNTLIEKNDTYRMAVVNTGTFGGSTPIGGFAASAKSVFVDFYAWEGIGEQCHMIFDKIDLSGRENARLRFDYAFANYPGFGPDYLKISVSEDCGETWDEVFSGSNSQINTAAPTTSRFIPNASQWDTLSIDMSAYDGAEELNIRFTGESGYGNSLFLDNIEVVSDIINSVDEAGVLANMVRAYPNPAKDLVNVDFYLAESSEVSIAIYDAAGKLVTVLANASSMPAGQHSLNWAPTLPGMYLIRIATENAAVTERVSVIR